MLTGGTTGGTSLRVWVDLEGQAKRKAEEASRRLNAVVTLYKVTDGVEKQVHVFRPRGKSALR